MILIRYRTLSRFNYFNSKSVFFFNCMRNKLQVQERFIGGIRFVHSISPLPPVLKKEDLNSENIYDKIIYNSKINRESFLTKKVRQDEEKRLKETIYEKPLSVSLKYLLDDYDGKSIKENESQEEEEGESKILLPYDKDILRTEVSVEDVENDDGEVIDWSSVQKEMDMFPQIPASAAGKKWMNDYEKYTQDEEPQSGMDEWGLDYGTSDTKIPVSRTPCGGCGAYLHCQDTSIPGYIPSEIFKKCKESDLRALTCQRCHFLQNYNTALSVSVGPDLYPKLLSKIKDEKALVIIMVDLTDFPCSIWPGILDIVGKKRPLFLVGNKVDLLWGDSKGWMNHVSDLLISSFPPFANIKHVQLISAKTGFGVEELINKLHKIWQYKGDVYLIGCTNVGKSTLFNSLLQSDYCKVKAVDLVQRATTAPWPGTTLNLLKFPILRPDNWRLYLRTMRLQQANRLYQQENKLKKEQLMSSKAKPKIPPQLIGHIGKTFQAKRDAKNRDSFSSPSKYEIKQGVFQGLGLDPNDKDFAQSHWLYDTPGVLHSDQILDLLTTEEIVLTLPRNVISPRTFLMNPGWTLFVGGLGRLDYLEGNKFVRVTVFSSKTLPVTICSTHDAQEIYNHLVGTEKMGIPIGRGERLNKWPSLKSSNSSTVYGESRNKSCADFVLSCCGWIAVTPQEKEICKFLPWTPEARGIHVRVPALLPFAVTLRGKRIHKLPVYTSSKPVIY